MGYGKIASAYSKITSNDNLFEYKKFYKKNAFASTYEMRSTVPSTYIGELDTASKSPLLESSVPMLPLNHPNSITDAIRRNEKDVVYIYEGLTKSVEVDVFKRIFKHMLSDKIPNRWRKITSDKFIKNCEGNPPDGVI